ncbi:hypothetical protein EV426DRAFT_709162 [Tirmania nivea]|nr:hypothetical protein EV426DRAFT_709162 [Tirmania nivea]
MDKDRYEILPDARIIRHLNMVLNSERLTEYEKEDDDEEVEEEENNEEED